MASPITAADFDVQNFSGDICEQIKKLLEMNNTLRTWFDWAFDDAGRATTAFQALFAAAFVPAGAIIHFPMPIANTPDGYLPCDGRAVSRTDYAGLFSAIGTTYGAGNGSTTFNVPDVRGRFLLGASNTYAATATGGEATHVLTVSELPAHTHNLPPGYELDGAPNEGAKLTADKDTHTENITLQTTSVGGDGAHNNMPPYLGCTAIIKI